LIYGFRGDAAAGIPDMWIFYEYDEKPNGNRRNRQTAK
jgi:hypothetical protein